MPNSEERTETIILLLRYWNAHALLSFEELLRQGLSEPWLYGSLSPAKAESALALSPASTKLKMDLPDEQAAASMPIAARGVALAKGKQLDSKQLNTEIESWTKQTQLLQKAFQQYGSSNTQMQGQCQELEQHLQTDQQTIQQFQQELQSSNS